MKRPATGERNGRAKLTWEKVEKIRKEYARGQSTFALALDYDMAQSTIWEIVTHHTWRRLEKEIEANATRMFDYRP